MKIATDLLTIEECLRKIDALTYPRISKEYIESRIKNHEFIRIGDTVTLCSIFIDNGYSVRGESACVSPENYREDIGQKLSYDNAFKKLWPLFGFLLIESIHRKEVAR